MTRGAVHTRRTAVVVVITALLMMTGCKHEDLRAIEDQPVTDLQIESAERMSRNGFGGGTALGKPSQASHVQRYLPNDGVSLQQVADDLRAEVIELGWGVEDKLDRRPEDKIQEYKFLADNDGRIFILSIRYSDMVRSGEVDENHVTIHAEGIAVWVSVCDWDCATQIVDGEIIRPDPPSFMQDPEPTETTTLE